MFFNVGLKDFKKLNVSYQMFQTLNQNILDTLQSNQLKHRGTSWTIDSIDWDAVVHGISYNSVYSMVEVKPQSYKVRSTQRSLTIALNAKTSELVESVFNWITLNCV